MNAPIPHQFDPENASILAAVSAAAYLEDAGWDSLGLRGFLHIATVDAPHTDTHALVTSDGDDCVVAFRGTQNLRDWLTDLDCAFSALWVEGAALPVHAGFKAAFDSITQDLNTALQRMGGFQRYWLTGHSLGGALALLCARSWTAPLAGVYTFGQPRAGGGRFAARYDAALRDRTFRVVHAADIVPRVPWLPGGYRHAGHEVFFPSPLPVRRDSVEPKYSGFDGLSPYQLRPPMVAQTPIRHPPPHSPGPARQTRPAQRSSFGRLHATGLRPSPCRTRVRLGTHHS